MDSLKVDKGVTLPSDVVAAKLKQADQYVVVENSSTYLDGSFMSYKAGQVLDDFAQIAALLASGCTFLKPLTPDTLVVKCLHCGGKVVVQNASNARTKS